MKSEKFWDGLHISLCGKLNLYAGTSFRGSFEKAMEQERLDRELETVSRANSQRHDWSCKQSWRSGNKKSRFFPYSRNNMMIGRNNRPQGSGTSVRQLMAPPRPVNAQFRRNIILLCNVCNKNHFGNCGNSRVRCYKCNELGYYARECLKKVLRE